MGFKNGCYVTCWADKQTQKVVTLYEKYAEVQVSTSKKNANARNGHETDFSGRVRFIGRAFEKIRTMAIADKDKLKLLEVETTNKYDAQKQRSFTNYICWEFEPAESKNTAPRQPEVIERNDNGTYSLGDMNDADLPF